MPAGSIGAYGTALTCGRPGRRRGTDLFVRKARLRAGGAVWEAQGWRCIAGALLVCSLTSNEDL
eukprot:25965-Chlamydomonas_euryale.AAC.1